jgi:hypothetical protein
MESMTNLLMSVSASRFVTLEHLIALMQAILALLWHAEAMCWTLGDLYGRELSSSMPTHPA